MAGNDYKPSALCIKYQDEILKRLKEKFDQSGLQQSQIAEMLNWKPQTVNRILGPNAQFVFSRVFDIANLLNMNINELMGTDYPLTQNSETAQDLQQTTHSSKLPEGVFITDPNNRAFKGIINDKNNPNDFYYFYTKSTIPEEVNVFLKGKLFLVEEIDAATNSSYCKASLVLEIGKADPETGTTETKEYAGEMVISQNMRSCYILLYGEHTAEINLIAFEHRYFNKQPLDCKLAGCLTVSAGDHNRPTHSKIILSRKELTSEHLTDLKGLLHITDPLLMIPESSIESSDDSDDILQLLNRFDAKKESYYIISAKHIIYSGGNQQELEQLVLRLRNMSTIPPYVKVSDTENSILYHYYTNHFLK